MFKNSIKNTVLSFLFIIFIYSAFVFLLILLESPSPDGINQLGDAVWYSIVTLTTVGYGDMTPATKGGRVIGYIFIVGSLGVLGYLIGKLNSIFNEIRESYQMGYNGTNFQNHIVIIGWDRFAKVILEQLVTENIPIAIVTDEQSDLELIRKSYSKNKVFILYSDYQNFELIRKTNIEHSSMVIINLKDNTDKLVYLLSCKKFFGDHLHYAVIPETNDLIETFKNIGATLAISKDDIASKIIASYLFEPDVAAYEEDLLGSNVDESGYDIQEYRMLPKNPYLNRKYNEVFYNIQKDFNCVIIGLARYVDGKRIIYKNPYDTELTVQLDDYLLLITNGSNADRIEEAFMTHEGFREGVL